MTRVIVCGSRGWVDRGAIASRLALLAAEEADLTIVVGYDPERGRPSGADRLAYQEATKLGLTVECHPAEWEAYSQRDYERFGRKGAGRKRNEAMAAAGASLCLAYWDGESTGTVDMINRCHDHGIPVDILRKRRETA